MVVVGGLLPHREHSHCILSPAEKAEESVGWPARIYLQQLCMDTGCSQEDLPEAIDDRDGLRERERELKKFMWAARQDDEISNLKRCNVYPQSQALPFLVLFCAIARPLVPQRNILHSQHKSYLCNTWAFGKSLFQTQVALDWDVVVGYHHLFLVCGHWIKKTIKTIALLLNNLILGRNRIRINNIIVRPKENWTRFS